MTSLLLPPKRLSRWLDNFQRRHGVTSLSGEDGALVARGADDSWAVVRLPWGREWAEAGPGAGEVGAAAVSGIAEDPGPAAEPGFAAGLDATEGKELLARFVAQSRAPADWGVLLVRKGGFAIARLHGEAWHASKTGRRHVQGRTKAGGQSQQRFARRRDNQAKAAYTAAADHAARLLLAPPCPVLVVGGDHHAVDEVLNALDPSASTSGAAASQRSTPRGTLASAVVPPWLPVSDPRRAVLEQAVTDAASFRLQVHNT